MYTTITAFTAMLARVRKLPGRVEVREGDALEDASRRVRVKRRVAVVKVVRRRRSLW